MKLMRIGVARAIYQGCGSIEEEEMKHKLDYERKKT
jgi:hypothetical protein